MRTEHILNSGAATKWVVVNTHPHKEHVALRNLAQQQFSSYCPFVRKRVRHARRAQDVLRPLFPSYLFVQMTPDLKRWHSIHSTIGVRSLVRFGERVGLLDGCFIQCLRARELDGAIVRPENPFSLGQQVRMSGGAFDGLVATIVAMGEKERLVVLMDILNRSVKIKTEARNIVAM